MTNTTPVPLINLPMAFPLAVDSLGRILAGANDTALRLYSGEGALLNAALAQAQTNSILVRGPGGFWGQDVYFIGTNWNLMRVNTRRRLCRRRERGSAESSVLRSVRTARSTPANSTTTSSGESRRAPPGLRLSPPHRPLRLFRGRPTPRLSCCRRR